MRRHYNPTELKDLNTATSGEFSGVGIEVTPESGYLKVIAPIDGGPAQEAGVKAGDFIIKINDDLVSNLSLGEAIKKMRGPNGSMVALTLVRGAKGQPFKVQLKRGR